MNPTTIEAHATAAREFMKGARPETLVSALLNAQTRVCTLDPRTDAYAEARVEVEVLTELILERAN